MGVGDKGWATTQPGPRPLFATLSRAALTSAEGSLDFSSTATKTQHLSLEAGVTPRGRSRRPKEPLHVNTASLRECVNASVLRAGCEHEYNLRPVL